MILIASLNAMVLSKVFQTPSQTRVVIFFIATQKQIQLSQQRQASQDPTKGASDQQNPALLGRSVVFAQLTNGQETRTTTNTST